MTNLDSRPWVGVDTRVGFAADLESFGENPAVILHDGRVFSYSELATRVDDMVRRLGSTRRLVLVAATNDLESVVAYLAALRGDHAVLLTSPQRADALSATYMPDVVVQGDQLIESWAGTAHNLHPDLALLMSTSGSTGSPKLVRLSKHNLQSNAQSIADYLDIRQSDRAATTLPMQYCYGLSVINSHLLQGAALLLTDNSVVDACFWNHFRNHGGTSLAGVPYTFELLDSIEFKNMELPALRYVTQAGGRMSPDSVRSYASLSERRGWKFFVMYGQTEATARMAYLPPHRALESPTAIGVAVPGGSFDLIDIDRNGHGELEYSGANVMLGYAESAGDLALGRTIHSLRTGDLARRTADGLYEIVGRKSRLVKLFGLRIDLDYVEQWLGAESRCTGNDERLVVATTLPVTGVAERVAERFGLPLSCVAVQQYNEMPRLPSNKVDYQSILQRATNAEPVQPSSVQQAFSTIFGARALDDQDTFTSLGGDSLSYIEMSVALGDALGFLPDRWQARTIADLSALAPQQRRWTQLEMSVLLRAFAIVAVVGTHVRVFVMVGGAHLLLAMAGWNFARFNLDAGQSSTSRTPRNILRSMAGIAVPTLAWVGTWASIGSAYGASSYLFINNYVNDGRQSYWFAETVLQILFVLTAMFNIPATRRLEARWPFAFALAVFGALLAVRSHGNYVGGIRELTTHVVAWVFAFGWLAQRASRNWQKLTVAGLGLLTIPGFFHSTSRDMVLLCGVVVLLTVPRVSLPRPVAKAVNTIAAASLSIYLSHFAIFPVLIRNGVPRPAVLVVVIVFGIAVAAATNVIQTTVCRLARRSRFASLGRFRSA